MGVKNIGELKDLDKCKKSLADGLRQARGKVMPFLLFENFKYATKVGPLLVIGEIPQPVVDEATANSAGLKAKGKCVATGKNDLEVKFALGTADTKKIDKAFELAKFSSAAPEVRVVDKLREEQNEAVQETGTDLEAKARADLQKQWEGLKKRAKQMESQLSADARKELLASANAFTKAMGKDGDPLTAYEPLMKLDKSLSKLELAAGKPPSAPVAVSKEVEAAYQKFAQEQESRNAQVDSAVSSARPATKPGKLSANQSIANPTVEADNDDAVKNGDDIVVPSTKQRSVAQAMADRKEAMDWQDEEVKKVKAASGTIKDLKTITEPWAKELKSKTDKARKEILAKAAEGPKIEAEIRKAIKKRESLDEDIAGYDENLEALKQRQMKEEDRQSRMVDLAAELEQWKKERAEAIDKAAALGEDLKKLQAAVQKDKEALQVVIDKEKEVLRKAIETKHPSLASQYPDLALSADSLLQDKGFDEAMPDAAEMFRDLKVEANKHGTGRHGAQTGLEQQARRVATGGATPDQGGNEFGTSRTHATTKDGNEIQEAKWHVTIKWELVEGQKVVKNKEEVLKEFVKQYSAENRVQAASSSSLFLSPELEKEAAQRAVDIVTKQCTWKEYQDDSGQWKPIDRVVVTVGPPRKNKAIGYGHGQAKIDDNVKVALKDANSILELFRQGKIDQNKMLAGLNSKLKEKVDPTRGENLGAEILPKCKVILDRTSSGWTTVSQYPCDASEVVGWSLYQKMVRSDSADAEGVGVKQCTGA